MRRVVVTGMGGITALGGAWPEIRAAMEAGKSGTRHMHEWDRLTDLNTKIGGAIDWFDHTTVYNRKKARSMGRVAVLAVNAAERALTHAGLIGDAVLQSGRAGVACGSSFGATEPVQDFAGFMNTGKAGSLNATSYIRMMSHTAPVNIAITFGLTGRVITTSSACTSGSQGIGFAFEAIREGHADIMVAGGAEQLCPTMAIVFDTLFATSTRNGEPATASRPFDKSRDGLVIGEGAAMLVLEEYEHARARGAVPIAEVVGFSTNSDGAHVTQPKAETQAVVMREALRQAGIAPGDVGFISGHGTATDTGDVAESIAAHDVFGETVPFHSLKGHFGHSLGACGGMEAWLTIEMMRDNWFPPTANLTEIDPRCAPLDYIVGGPRTLDIAHFVSNNFAFGGLNTSLVFRRL
ncbi:MAG TPA: beta-ketoacyl-ACP synthase [Rhizomicrobium sp.]|jgi:3-oxoacyl-[acyl-carrier-protein] synthase II|nr:beta-ketoacyl-ACP synthase [Rhizomicrobium sp.]